MKQKSIHIETLKIFWHALAAEPRILALSGLNLVSILFISTITPLMIGRMIGSMAQPGANPFQYLPYVIGAALIGAITNRIGFRAYLTTNARGASRIQLLAFDTLLKRSVGFHNNNVSGKLVSDAIAYASSFQHLFELTMMTLLPFVIILVGGLIFVSMSSWQLGVIVLGMAIFAFTASILNERNRNPIRKKRVTVGKELTGHFADSLVNMQAVITFAAENRELKTHKKLNHLLRDMRIRDWTKSSNDGNIRIFVLYAFQIALISVLVLQVRSNPALLGIGIFTFIFTTTLTGRLFDVDRFLRLADEALLTAQPMTEVICDTVEIVDAPHAKQLEVRNGDISFDAVSFTYEDGDSLQNVFKDLNLHIQPGEKIGLVGPSGGGKSTLTRLLLRFEDVQEGTISVDGQEIKNVTQHSLRTQISYVPQEPLLFHRSIRENIAYGHGQASNTDIEHAAKLAHADEFIAQLPQGYDTIVGERGVKLSGGQRQRIAIARAILKDAPLLVLDEATSALDSESEVYIQEAFATLMKNRTTIVIAHRLSTIQKMDRIVVLDKGKIIEQGSHGELLEKHGLYARLWTRQSGGFIEE